MPTEIEIKVMKLLTAIEIPPSAGQYIENLGNEAVTVLCETALGSYPGLRPKVRNNAVALLGYMTHPQAGETLILLVNDANSDVAIRAIRASSQLKSKDVVPALEGKLEQVTTSSLIAAEAVQALIQIGSPQAIAALNKYVSASPVSYPHRGSTMVKNILSTYLGN